MVSESYQDTTEAALDAVQEAIETGLRVARGASWGAMEDVATTARAALSTIRAELERLRKERDNVLGMLEVSEEKNANAVELANDAAAERDAALAALRETYAVIRDRLKSASMSVGRSDNDHAAFDHAAGILRRALSQEETP